MAVKLKLIPRETKEPGCTPYYIEVTALHVCPEGETQIEVLAYVPVAYKLTREEWKRHRAQIQATPELVMKDRSISIMEIHAWVHEPSVFNYLVNYSILDHDPDWIICDLFPQLKHIVRDYNPLR